jgi:hypothetical protein
LLLIGGAISTRGGSSSVTASSAGIGFGYAQGSHWYWSDWVANASVIKWIPGPNSVDGTTFTHAPSSEDKFINSGTVLNPILAPRSFDGVTFNVGPGVYGSHAFAQGQGHSVNNGGWFNSGLEADWDVFASGLLGTIGPTASYSSQMEAIDPWSITTSDLAGITNSLYYSIYVPFGLEAGSFDSSGRIGLDVNYTTATVTDNIFSVSLYGTNVTVIGDPNATFFALSSLSDDPTISLTNWMSLDEIRNAFASDLSTNGLLQSPIYFGAVLTNLLTPTIDMGGGIVAEVGVGANASDWGSATIPEPTAISLITVAVSLTALVNYGRWKPVFGINRPHKKTTSL